MTVLFDEVYGFRIGKDIMFSHNQFPGHSLWSVRPVYEEINRDIVHYGKLLVFQLNLNVLGMTSRSKKPGMFVCMSSQGASMLIM